MDVALAAVIVSGIVAISTVLLAPVLRLVIDSLSWRRQQKAERLKKAEDVSIEFLAMISAVGTVEVYDVDHAKFKSELLAKSLEWERAIWEKSNKKERERIKALREMLSRGSVNTYREKFDSTVEEVLDLSHSVTERLD